MRSFKLISFFILLLNMDTSLQQSAVSCLPPVIENGSVPGAEDKEYRENEVLTFECDASFIRVESRPSRCIKQGSRAEWSPTPACEPIKCRLTLPAHKTTYQPPYKNVFTPGEKVAVTCEENYWVGDRLTTTATSTCTATGEWSIRPICQEVRCTIDAGPHVRYWYPRYTTLESTTSYSCVTGYRRTGGASQARCTRGGWIPDPLCEKITCRRKHVANADIISLDKELYSYDDVVEYECKEGYRGRFSTTCQERGWSHHYPCAAITCREENYENADIVDRKNTYNYNDQVEFKCKNGFRGNFIRTCGEDGWTGDTSCHEVSCYKKEVPNAEIQGYNLRKTKYRHNDRLQYSCKKGYEGGITLTCQDGTWTESGQCTGKTCQKHPVINANIVSIEKETYNESDKVQYECINDSELHFTATCEDGEWIGMQSCPDANACRKDNIVNGYTVGPFKGKLYYSCNDGYKLFSKGWWGEAKCRDRKWIGLGRCIEKTSCGQTPDIPHGKVETQDKAYEQNETAQIFCNEGYRPAVDNLTCHLGKWNAHNVPLKKICRPIARHCPAPDMIENAVLLSPYKKEYLSGTEERYQCHSRSHSQGNNMIRCEEGEWLKEDFQCIPFCEVLDAEWERMRFTSITRTYENDESFSYRCKHISDNREGTATCVKGAWNRTEECEVKPCENPDDTPNGFFELISGEDFVFGAQIRYYCNPGYQMMSRNDTRTCMLGKWSNHVPTCSPRTCELPPADEEVIVSNLPDNDDAIFPHRFITFSCKYHGKLIGSSRLICGTDGNWNKPFPHCEAIICEVDVTALNSRISVNGLLANETMKVEHKLQFRCNEQYELVGSEEITCLETGRWSKPFPTCAGKCNIAGLPDDVHITTDIQGDQLREGEKLTFACKNSQLYIHGKAEVQCLADGQWSDDFPTCGPALPCNERSPPLENGDTKNYNKLNYDHNERVEYICANLHTMKGDAFKTCVNGNWTGEMRCLKPCTVNTELMRQHGILFKYSYQNKLYSKHEDKITFVCAAGKTHDGEQAMVQHCVDGVMQLPTCQ